VDLPLMSEEECKEFFSKTFGKKMVTIADDALSLMIQRAGGYPMLMHEVGDAVFWRDEDNRIDKKDARLGIIEAARNVGKKYIGPQVENVFRNRTYSSILLRVGKMPTIGANFNRQELLRESAPEKERKNLDNFLNKAKKLGIIKDAEARGEYRFVNPLYHLYIWYMAQEQSEAKRNSQKSK